MNDRVNKGNGEESGEYDRVYDTVQRQAQPISPRNCCCESFRRGKAPASTRDKFPDQQHHRENDFDQDHFSEARSISIFASRVP
jgi:hypothetical protein